MLYSFLVYNHDASEVWDIPFTNLVLTEQLNNAIDARLQIPFTAFNQYAQRLNTTIDAILAGGFRSWKFFVDDTLLYRGVLSHRTIDGGSSGATSITLHCTDYVGLLGSRYTGLEDIYTQDDSSDIAWQMIYNTQNDSSTYGNLNITRGANPTTVNRDRTMRRTRILDELIGMSRAKLADGFDFNIDNTLAFNIYYPQRGSLRPEIVFSPFNIIKWTSNLPLTSKLVNRVHVIGEGFGENMITATREDTTPMATWGLLEGSLSEKSVKLVSTLEARGDRLLEKKSEPMETINITTTDGFPSITQYGVGDTVSVAVSNTSEPVALRIFSRTINTTPQGNAVVDLTFEEQDA